MLTLKRLCNLILPCVKPVLHIFWCAYHTVSIITINNCHFLVVFNNYFNPYNGNTVTFEGQNNHESFISEIDSYSSNAEEAPLSVLIAAIGVTLCAIPVATVIILDLITIKAMHFI